MSEQSNSQIYPNPFLTSLKLFEVQTTTAVICIIIHKGIVEKTFLQLLIFLQN